MSEPFRIAWSWRPRPRPEKFSEKDYTDASELYMGLRQLLANTIGSFTLEFGPLRLEFEIDPDLSIVFEDLPGLLQALATGQGAIPKLYFAEQGTDLKLLFDRQGDDLAVRFQKGYSVGEGFANLPEAAPAVSAATFASEWTRFLREVLDEIISVRPGVKDDESYEEFEAALAPSA